MNACGVAGLATFRASAGAAELESSDERWRVIAWPWTSAFPTRVTLENAAHHQVVFSQDEGGIWRFSDDPNAPHTRNAAETEREISGGP